MGLRRNQAIKDCLRRFVCACVDVLVCSFLLFFIRVAIFFWVFNMARCNLLRPLPHTSTMVSINTRDGYP